MPRLVTAVELLRRSTKDHDGLRRRQVAATTTGISTSLSGPITITITNSGSPTPSAPSISPSPTQSPLTTSNSLLPSTQLAATTSPDVPLATFADSPALNNSISPGVIGGIIVGTVAIVIVGLFLFLRHRAKYGFSKPKKNRPPSPDTTMGISTFSTRMGPDTSRGTVTFMSQYSESKTYTLDDTSRLSTIDIPPPVPPKNDNYPTYPPLAKLPPPLPSHKEPASPANEGQIARPAPPVSVNYLAKAIYTYHCTLPDELPIQLSQVVRVLVEYDDGWSLCEARDGRQGMVPMECLEIRGRQSMGSPSLLPYTRELNRQHSLRASSIAFSQILNPSP